MAATAVIAGITADSVGPLISLSGAAAVISAIALTVWAPQSKLLFAAVPVSAGVSLLVTFTYQGPARSAAANWWTAETLALMILVVVGIRRPKAWTAAALAVVLAVTITLSPLRIALTVVPPSSNSETLQLCLVWAILAIVAIGIGSYLRGLDARGRAALVAERRAERMNLARDLHDYAAHDVTAVVVLVEAAQVLAKEDPQRALELLPEIGAAGAHALEAMDHTVQLLTESPAAEERNRALDAVRQPEPADGAIPRQSGAARRDLSELASLVERFNRTGSPQAVLDVAAEGMEVVPRDVSKMGYRVIVEALTNVRRHAATASRVVIRICRETSAGRSVLRLTVTDDAPHPQPGLAVERPSGAGGTGISGLSARAEELGGALSAGPRQPGGWQVALVLPVDTAHEPGTINLPNG
ncbi:sensor histidine kinase [Streptomyces sp. NPDC021212]|uniref:sensor histidine kinase n=1 Tax=Streptomyces sp. NPDC021212 TaxID=3365118 RepID=UPI0037A2D9A3